MNPAEYETMASLEDEHWWYQGLRDLLTRILQSPLLKHEALDCVLDIGCGTGANLKLLQQILAPSRLSGFDCSTLAIEHARQKAATADVYQSDLCEPEIRRTGYDLLLCSDVLYMTDLDQSTRGLRKLTSCLRPGGFLVLHLPAMHWLYSRHDIAVHTRHRFSRAEVVRLFGQLELEIELLTYRMFLLFPAVVMARLPSLLGRAALDVSTVRSDITLPAKPVNTLLKRIVEAENRLILKGVRFPFGSSLIAVGRKP